MPVSPRCRRAHISPVLLAVLAPLVMLLAFRAGPTWNGVRLGEADQDIVAALGQPESRIESETITHLKYRDMEIFLRDGRAYSLLLRGHATTLRNHACLALGLPLSSDDDATLWSLGNVTAMLCNDALSVHGD